METHVELTLIAACQQGDPSAFRQVYDLHSNRIFALCRHMSGNAEDAADLTQEAFVDAFKGIQRFRAESSFGTWLYRIAVNRCLKAARRGRPEARSFDDDNGAIDRGPTPEEQLVRKETNRRMQSAIDHLPESLRVVFVLGTVEGLRYRQIADVLECTEDAVKMRMHRARKRVRDALSIYLNE